MAHENEEIKVGRRQQCHDWPLGLCNFGGECAREHHPNLDPTLPSKRQHHDYSVPNALGSACQRCLQAAREASLHLGKYFSCANMVQCDKKGRGGEDDPCSECRWFGGQSCKCSLALDTTYNDQLWGVMITRDDHTLGPFNSRAVGKSGKSPPVPIPDAKIKAGWQGETKDQLLAKGDMLPSYVRELPRAYLVPPRTSRKGKRGNVHKAVERKRKRDTSSNTTSPTASAASTEVSILPQFPPPPSFSRPPPDARQGEVVKTSWSWEAGRWEHEFKKGAKVIQGANPPSGQAQLPDVCYSCLLLEVMSLTEQQSQNQPSPSLTSRPRPISKLGLPPPASPAVKHHRSTSISDEDRRPTKKHRV